MTRTELAEFILTKAFSESGVSFTRTTDEANNDIYIWTGQTKVRRKKDNQTFDVSIDVRLKASPRMRGPLSACLCRSDGVKFNDLRTVSVVDSRFNGSVKVTGLPSLQGEVISLPKFIKECDKK